MTSQNQLRSSESPGKYSIQSRNRRRRGYSHPTHPRPIQALQQRDELPRCQPHHPLAQRRPAKRALFETLGRQNQARAVPEQQLHPIGPLGSKHIDHAAERVRAQRLVNHPPRARPSPCGNRPASSRSGPSRPRRERSCRSLQRANDPRQRRAVGGQRNARDHRADEDFQDRSVQRSLLSRRLQHHRRKAGRVRPLDRAAPSGPSPSKQLLRGDPVTPRDLGHHRPHRQCLLENPSFLVGRPPTTTPRSREHLDPTRVARLRLKLMVKHIHVPIPNQRSESATSHVIKEGAVRTALTALVLVIALFGGA